MGEFMPSHIIVVIIVLLLFFGPSRLPQLGQSLGKAIRGFKDGVKDVTNENQNAQNPPPPQQISSQSQNQTASETQKQKNPTQS